MPGGQLGKPGLSVGKLRQQVKIQSPDEVDKDEFGQANVSQAGEWSDVATTWANVVPITGREFMLSDKEQANITHRILMRHRTDVDETCRLVWLGNGNGAILNIIAVMAFVGDANYLEIWAKQQKF